MGISSREIMVYASCLQNPNFTQNQPNATQLCTDELLHKSVCTIAEEEFMGCFCIFEPGQSFFVIPKCSWRMVDEDGNEFSNTTTTETITTSLPETTSPILTYPEDSTTIEPTTELITNGPVNCSASTNLVPNGELSCDGLVCQLFCDPGFAPKQLKNSRTFFPASIYCSDLEYMNIKCIPIQDICELDTYQYELDTKKSVSVMSKPPIDNTLGGVVYVVSCEVGSVLEFTGHQHQKMRCVCKHEKDGFICRKSHYFGSNLGLCVDGDGNSGGFNDYGNGGGWDNSGGFDNDWHGIDNDELGFTLAVKRLKFSNFLRSMYDAFWYGPSALSITQME